MLYSPIFISVIEVVIVTVPVLLTVAYVTVAERKTMASMQRRLGPNIIGYYGLLQAFADALKLLLKEYVSPTQANLVLFFLGPIITLIFSLLGFSVIPYGPGLAISDFDLGILYMLAVSSLSTYGILLAGLTISPLITWVISKTLGEFQETFWNFQSQLEEKSSLIFLTYFVNIRYEIVLILLINYWLNFKYSTTSRWDSREVDNFTTSAQNLKNFILLSSLKAKPKLSSVLATNLNNATIDPTILFFVIKGNKAFNSKVLIQSTTYIPTYRLFSIFYIVGKPNPVGKRYYSTKIEGIACATKKEKKSLNIEELKPLHNLYIKDLYKDRNAIAKPFDDKVLVTYNDIKKRSELVKKWGSLSCIYLIEYKYNCLVYYIGRTTLFKRRLNNHLQPNTNSKFHLFVNLVGWEHFKISIIEICSAPEQGARENYYLQKYLPLLNTSFSSSFSESQIHETLATKLSMLKDNNTIYVSGKSKEVYVYEIMCNQINQKYAKHKSIIEASQLQKIARGTISIYIDTNIPFRGKLYNSKPIIDLKETFKLVKTVSNDFKLNSNIAQEVWAYDAQTLELRKGNPFVSKTQASHAIGISRNVINSFIDTSKAEGIKGTYLFSKQLTDEEIRKLLTNINTLQLGNKKKVWASNSQTLDLINNFPSLKLAAESFNVEYRTNRRHLETKTARPEKLYLFSK